MNYLRPDIKRGNITPDEDDLIIQLHTLKATDGLSLLVSYRVELITRSRITGTPLSSKNSEAKEPTLIHTELTLPVVPQDPKKRRNNRNNNSNSKKQNKIKTIADAEKTRVINPKPIRLSSLKSFSESRNTSFDWNECSSQEGDTEFGNPWSNDENCDGVGFLIGNAQSYDLVNSTSLASERHEPRLDDNVAMEKLYEEYLQLLKPEEIDLVQLDSSFAGSLLI